MSVTVGETGGALTPVRQTEAQRPGVRMRGSVKFWDRIADRYAKRPVADEAAYQKKLGVTREYLRRDMEVLELGCGTGSTAIAHASRVGHIHAIDISSRMIEIARAKAAAQNVVNVSFEQSTVDDLAVPPRSADVVMAHSLLHLLADREAAIAKVYAMLKPGGVFVTSTACLGDFMPWFRYIAPIGAFLGLIPMVKVFTADPLCESLTRAGFEIDNDWAPGKGKARFIVVRKTTDAVYRLPYAAPAFLAAVVRFAGSH